MNDQQPNTGDSPADAMVKRNRQINNEMQDFQSYLEAMPPDLRAGVESLVRAKIRDKLNMAEKAEEAICREVDALVEKKILEDEIRDIENPMYFLSAIELMEIKYIPNDTIRNSMTIVERWSFILKLKNPSVKNLRKAIRKTTSITIDNFPHLIKDAYDDCRREIREYYYKKKCHSHWNSEKTRKFALNSLQFGMNLVCDAVQMLTDSLHIGTSPARNGISSSSDETDVRNSSSDETHCDYLSNRRRSSHHYKSSRRSHGYRSRSRRYSRSRSPHPRRRN